MARQHTAKLRRYISNYGLKVDARYVCVTNVLFNDEKEHAPSITSHVINMDLDKNFYPVDSWACAKDLFIRDDEGLKDEEDVEWDVLSVFESFVVSYKEVFSACRRVSWIKIFIQVHIYDADQWPA